MAASNRPEGRRRDNLDSLDRVDCPPLSHVGGQGAIYRAPVPPGDKVRVQAQAAVQALDSPTFRLELKALADPGGVPVAVRLRRALKVLGRAYRLRVVSIVPEVCDQSISTPRVRPDFSEKSDRTVPESVPDRLRASDEVVE